MEVLAAGIKGFFGLLTDIEIEGVPVLYIFVGLVFLSIVIAFVMGKKK